MPLASDYRRVAERLTFAGSWFQAFFVSVLIMASVGSMGGAISSASNPRSRRPAEDARSGVPGHATR